MSQLWIYAFIIVAGCLQAFAGAMNGQINKSLVNPWLASIVSFGLALAVLLVLFAVNAKPLPTGGDVAAMPWWAPLGGIVGGVSVFAGLLFIQKIGAGPITGITITANLVTSLLVDRFALLGMQQHALSLPRIVGALLMIGGVTLISRF